MVATQDEFGLFEYEIISSSECAKNIDQFLNDLSSGGKTRFAILHNEHIEAIVISATEYERLYHTKIAYENWRNERRAKIRAACEDPTILRRFDASRITNA